MKHGSYSTVWIFFMSFPWVFYNKIDFFHDKMTGHKIVEECITSHGLDKNVHHNFFLTNIFPWVFHEFWHFSQIPWVFQARKLKLQFSRFSRDMQNIFENMGTSWLVVGRVRYVVGTSYICRGNELHMSWERVCYVLLYLKTWERVGKSWDELGMSWERVTYVVGTSYICRENEFAMLWERVTNSTERVTKLRERVTYVVGPSCLCRGTSYLCRGNEKHIVRTSYLCRGNELPMSWERVIYVVGISYLCRGNELPMSWERATNS